MGIRNTALLMVAMLGLAGAASARDIAVVSAKAGAGRAITLADFAKELKSPTRKWPDGKDITIVLPDLSSPEVKIFAQKVLGQTPEEFKAFLATANQSRKVFMVVGNNTEVLKAVDAAPGTIGLVDIYNINGSVSVIKLDGKLPLEPGYSLHGS